MTKGVTGKALFFEVVGDGKLEKMEVKARRIRPDDTKTMWCESRNFIRTQRYLRGTTVGKYTWLPIVYSQVV